MKNKFIYAKQIDKSFEKEWNEYFRDILNNYGKRHKTKFGRWFAKPDYLNEDSNIYRLIKMSSRLFYKKRHRL